MDFRFPCSGLCNVSTLFLKMWWLSTAGNESLSSYSCTLCQTIVTRHHGHGLAIIMIRTHIYSVPLLMISLLKEAQTLSNQLKTFRVCLSIYTIRTKTLHRKIGYSRYFIVTLCDYSAPSTTVNKLITRFSKPASLRYTWRLYIIDLNRSLTTRYMSIIMPIYVCTQFPPGGHMRLSPADRCGFHTCTLIRGVGGGDGVGWGWFTPPNSLEVEEIHQ